MHQPQQNYPPMYFQNSRIVRFLKLKESAWINFKAYFHSIILVILCIYVCRKLIKWLSNKHVEYCNGCQSLWTSLSCKSNLI